MKDLARTLTTEAEVQRSLMHYLETQGVEAWRQQAGRVEVVKGPHRHWIQLAPEGASDITGFLPRRFGPNAGRHLALEVKRPGGGFKPGQIPFLRRVNDAGGLGFWTDSLRIAETVFKWLLSGSRVEIEVSDDGAQQIRLAD